MAKICARAGQEFILGVALKRQVQSHSRCVSADANFSERVHPEI